MRQLIQSVARSAVKINRLTTLSSVTSEATSYLSSHRVNLKTQFSSTRFMQIRQFSTTQSTEEEQQRKFFFKSIDESVDNHKAWGNSLKKLYDEIFSSLGKKVSQLEEKNESLKESFTRLSKDFENVFNQIDIKKQETIKNISDEFAAHMNTFNNSVLKANNDLVNLKSTTETDLTNLKNNFKNEIEQEKNDGQKKLDKTITEGKTNLDTMITQGESAISALTQKATNNITALLKKAEDAQKDCEDKIKLMESQLIDVKQKIAEQVKQTRNMIIFLLVTIFIYENRKNILKGAKEAAYYFFPDNTELHQWLERLSSSWFFNLQEVKVLQDKIEILESRMNQKDLLDSITQEIQRLQMKYNRSISGRALFNFMSKGYSHRLKIEALTALKQEIIKLPENKKIKSAHILEKTRQLIANAYCSNNLLESEDNLFLKYILKAQLGLVSKDNFDNKIINLAVSP